MARQRGALFSGRAWGVLMGGGKPTRSILTKHGERRVRKRQKCPKKSAEARAQEALTQGLPHWRAKGQVKAFLDQVWEQHGGQYMVMHHGALYVFGTPKGPLITTYPLGGKLGQEAIKQQRRYKADSPVAGGQSKGQ